ncbi:MAG: AMP-binding protein, partial [Myxococcota bacterium]
MSLRDLVIDSARNFPDHVSVVVGETETTYLELDGLADRFARALHDRGVRPGDRVGIWLEKSAAAIAAMQGALRIGAAYVPLDPKNPAARIRRIVAGADLAALVTPAEWAPAVLDADLAEVPHVDPQTLPAPGDRLCLGTPGDDDLAYILYTSGSTGEPKGVCISERNALAFVEWAADEVRVGPADRLSNHAPFHFDLSVLDLYVAFLAGARVCVVPDGIAY